MLSVDEAEIRDLKWWSRHHEANVRFLLHRIEQMLNGEDIEVPLGSNPLVHLSQGASQTIKLTVFCNGDCSAGDTATMQVYGKTDPKWYDGDTESGQGYTYSGHPSTDGQGCQVTKTCVDTTSPKP